MNSILGALLANVHPNQLEITSIAMKAFARAAPITSRNFAVEEQKQYLMSQLFEACKINNEEILTSVMQAMNDIARVNYDYMREFI